jgi:hypothetical protein
MRLLSSGQDSAGASRVVSLVDATVPALIRARNRGSRHVFRRESEISAVSSRVPMRNVIGAMSCDYVRQVF